MRVEVACWLGNDGYIKTAFVGLSLLLSLIFRHTTYSTTRHTISCPSRHNLQSLDTVAKIHPLSLVSDLLYYHHHAFHSVL